MQQVIQLIEALGPVVVALMFFALVLMGKGKQALAILQEIDDVMDSLPKQFLPTDLQGSGYYKQLNELRSKVTDSTRLTRDVIDDCVEIGPGGDVQIDKARAVTRALTSGDAKKVYQKIGKSAKKLWSKWF